MRKLVRTNPLFDKQIPPSPTWSNPWESFMSRYDDYDPEPPARRGPSFLTLFIGKLLLLAVTIVVVWLLYGYLFAFQLDFLGWAYTKLQPLTLQLYALVDNYFPDSVRYKFRAAITDDLGQRALFLLLLTAVVELTLYTFFRMLKSLFVRR
jgi:hypothetical protein